METLKNQELDSVVKQQRDTTPTKSVNALSQNINYNIAENDPDSPRQVN